MLIEFFYDKFFVSMKTTPYDLKETDVSGHCPLQKSKKIIKITAQIHNHVRATPVRYWRTESNIMITNR